MTILYWLFSLNQFKHGLRTPREEITFTARPKIHSHSQIFRYGRSIFCLPHRPNFSDIFDLCLHWVSVVRVWKVDFFVKFYCLWICKIHSAKSAEKRPTQYIVLWSSTQFSHWIQLFYLCLLPKLRPINSWEKREREKLTDTRHDSHHTTGRNRI